MRCPSRTFTITLSGFPLWAFERLAMYYGSPRRTLEAFLWNIGMPRKYRHDILGDQEVLNEKWLATPERQEWDAYRQSMERRRAESLAIRKRRKGFRIVKEEAQ